MDGSHRVAIISIHALRKESDVGEPLHDRFGGIISIHALRKESDTSKLARKRGVTNFNPRSP